MSSNERLLIVTQSYRPEISAGATRLSSLAGCLTDLGWRVDVLTGLPNYPEGVIPSRYRGRLHLRERMRGIDVHRTWLIPTDGKSGVLRLFNLASFTLSSTVWAALRGGQYSVVLASSPPLTGVIAGYVISQLFETPLVLDIRDLYPDILIDMDVISPHSLPARAVRTLARTMYRQAERICVVTPTKQARLAAQGIPEGKIRYVPNGVSSAFVSRPVDPAILQQWPQLENRFVVTYAGLVGRAQGVGLLLDVAQRLPGHPEIAFLIIGDGVERAQLEARTTEQELTNVVFIGQQSREKIPSFLAASAASFVPLVSERLVDSVPSKMLEAMALGCPVILSAAGDSSRLLSEADAGIVVPPANAGALADAILDLYERCEALSEPYGSNGRAFARDHLMYDQIAREMDRLLREVMDPKPDL